MEHETDLMRSSRKSNPAIIKGNEKLSFVQLHTDLASSKQHKGINGHHAAIPDENTAGFHFLMVNQVGACVMANLKYKTQIISMSQSGPIIKNKIK